MNTNRRNFIKNTGALIGGAAVLSQLPMNAFGAEKVGPKKFGFQVWTVREELVKDFPGTLHMMAKLGYKQVEMCSPLGYESSGFGPLNKMSGTEMKKIIDDTGLKCISSHYGLGELRDSLDNRIEWATQMGMKQMILSTFWIPDGTLDDYKKSADELNKIAEKTKAAGIQMGFHNHNMEFEKRDGQLIYDVLMERFDPDLVKMQFQVAVIDIGYKAADYFRKYPGRFISAHLADWSSQKKEQVPIGQGDVDWEDLFKAAKIGGVKNYFVEMAPETFKESAEFLLS